MSSKTWVVDPSEHWQQEHILLFPKANLPDTPRCPDTLTTKQCELIEGHPSHHVILLGVLQRLRELADDPEKEIE